MIDYADKKSQAFSLTIGLIFFSFFLSTAVAIEVAQIEPAKIRLSIPPGNSKTGTVKIYNFSGEAKNIKIYLEDWAYSPIFDGSKDFSPAGTIAFSAAKWISFVPAELTLPPYGKQTINYTVKVPADAKGGHYAVLFFENYATDPAKAQEGVSVNLAVRIASLFYIEAEGTIDRRAQIEDLKVTREEDKLKLSAQFCNLGNVDINTGGTFFIMDQKGRVYARGEFNEVYTLPGDTATLASVWKESIPKGKYYLTLTLGIGKALQETGLKRVPALTREAEIEIGEDSQVVSIGELK